MSDECDEWLAGELVNWRFGEVVIWKWRAQVSFRLMYGTTVPNYTQARGNA